MRLQKVKYKKIFKTRMYLAVKSNNWKATAGVKTHFESCLAFKIWNLFRSGLPDGLFLNQNPNLGKLWRVLQWKMLIYFVAIW
jgi:hypothetical protein